MDQSKLANISAVSPDPNGPITMLVARSAGIQVNDMPGDTALENDTFNPGSGDGDTI